MAYEIFISYKRLDKENVFKIKDEIEKAVGKDTCWIDMDGIESDAQFADVIINAINRAQIFLFMYSRHHAEIKDLDNDWTVREINFAQKKKKRIVFVNIDGTPLTDWFEMMFGTKQQVDASSKQAMQKLYQDLNKWLTESPNKGPINDSTPDSNTDRALHTHKTVSTPAADSDTNHTAAFFVKLRQLFRPSKNNRTPLYATISAILLVILCVFGWILYNSQHSEDPIQPTENVVLESDSVAISSTVEPAAPIASVSNNANGSSTGNSPATTKKVSNNNKPITYTASEKLDLKAKRFTPAFTSHTFDGETGTITFPERLTEIGYKAFSGCKSLQSITIPNSVTSIGYGAFEDCKSLQSITIPNGVTSIGNWAFDGCESLQSITIPNSVTSIGDFAFKGCESLQSITIPNSVTSIGDEAFDWCSSLQSITIPNSVTSIGVRVFSCCKSLQSITIPNSVTSIGNEAFLWCSSLQSITIPNSVTSIGVGVFSCCTSLQSITIPNSVTSIGYEAFYGCESLKSINIPNSVTSIGGGVLNGCERINKIVIESSKYYTESEILISNEGELISCWTKGSHITIPNSVTSIGNRAFYGCTGLTAITIPNSVTSIGGSAFWYCKSLQSITIPNSVTSIGGGAFHNCTSLQIITIPNSVTSIGYEPFEYCTSLREIRIPIGTSAKFEELLSKYKDKLVEVD